MDIFTKIYELIEPRYYTPKKVIEDIEIDKAIINPAFNYKRKKRSQNGNRDKQPGAEDNQRRFKQV